MKSEVEKLVETPGIVAAAKTKNGSTDLRVDPSTDARRWQPLLAASEQILRTSGEDEAKITLGDHSVVVMRSGPITISLVVIKSHSVVKSLKRMVRRAFKRLGNPTSDPVPRQPAITTTPVRPLGGVEPDPVQDDKGPTRPF